MESKIKEADVMDILRFYRYEDEINKRAAAENEFVLLKKVKILYISVQI